MSSNLNEHEFHILIDIANKCNYVLETGSGNSTIRFDSSDIKVVSIDLSAELHEKLNYLSNTTFLTGWSITDDDMIKKGHKLFRRSRYKNTPDEAVAFNREIMTGETDLIRKAIKQFGVPEMFFCDTGEYCGYVEWLIMKDILPIGGFIALHDIHYPRSIKNYLAYNEILVNPDKWELLYKSFTVQGLCIARKLK